MNSEFKAASDMMKITGDGLRISLRVTGNSLKKAERTLKAIYSSGIRSAGRVNVQKLLSEGKALDVYELDGKMLNAFRKEAKRYGLRYTIVRKRGQRPEEPVDVLIVRDDAPRYERIIDNLKREEIAKVEREILGDGFTDVTEEYMGKDMGIGIDELHNLYGSVGSVLDRNENERER